MKRIAATGKASIVDFWGVKGFGMKSPAGLDS